MEKAILKLRKRKINQLFNMLKDEVDFNSSLIDSRVLEELTDVIYLLLDNKNS